MRSVFRVFVVLGLVTAAASAAQAQSVAEPNTVTATPFVSVSFGTPHNLGSSLGIGGAIGYDWTSNLGVELELGRVFDVAGADEALDYKLTTAICAASRSTIWRRIIGGCTEGLPSGSSGEPAQC